MLAAMGQKLTMEQERALEALAKNFVPKEILENGSLARSAGGVESLPYVTAEEAEQLDFTTFPLYVLDADAFVEKLGTDDVMDYIRQDESHILLCGKSKGEVLVLSEMIKVDGKWRKGQFSMQDRNGLPELFDWLEQCKEVSGDKDCRLVDVLGSKYAVCMKDGEPMFFYYRRLQSLSLDEFVIRVVARVNARDKGNIC